MSDTVSQDILNALTDVDMTRLAPEPEIASSIMVRGHRVPVHACGTVIVGSGAAGLRAAVELKRRDTDVADLDQAVRREPDDAGIEEPLELPEPRLHRGSDRADL